MAIVLALEKIMYALVVIVLFQPLSEWNEVRWSAQLCQDRFNQAPVNGKTVEVRTPDGSRADIVSAEYAVEVEWAKKWKEAPAQAILYGIGLNKKPMVLLLVRDPAKEQRYILRCMVVCAKIGVRMEVHRVP